MPRYTTIPVKAELRELASPNGGENSRLTSLAYQQQAVAIEDVVDRRIASRQTAELWIRSGSDA
jgi:hypothetical protein